jgi:hypothetical protein
MSVAEDTPLRRDWLSYLIQSLATICAVVIAMLAWGQNIEGQIAEQRAAFAALAARVEVIEHERASDLAARRAADAALALRLDTMSATLATISAQLADLRKALRR